MRKEFSKLVRQTFLCSMIHKICINLGQYAICHNTVHEYPERDPLGSHRVEEDCSMNLTPQKSNYLLSELPLSYYYKRATMVFVEDKTSSSNISEFFKFNYHMYGEFRKFGSVLMKYLKRSDEILQIVCGSSCLADSLYDNGFKNIFSIDIVRSVIRKQIYRNRKRRPELTFSSGDATKLEYADE
ncbi:Methyltransferase-like protein 13 [Trichinella patagoniensis]|uniref:Methyltransferase-like protein 13 n=1 Tax=Trichinella patagoniensis TaxID=990121 RepID=A0A0V0ZER7_9BILA|nr:Methyltransferase-like protein 13 [Trichinella patagoniensis]